MSANRTAGTLPATWARAGAAGSASGRSHAPVATLRLPERFGAPGLLVGWSLELEHAKRPMGFAFGDPERSPASGYIDPILMEKEGHLITIAPTGAGKGVGCIIPALLRHEGPVIAIDPKGENVAITARRRREIGQQVVVLDPIGVTEQPGAALNPLDLIDPEAATSVDEAAAIATAMIDYSHDERNRFWYDEEEPAAVARAGDPFLAHLLDSMGPSEPV
jgi:type IV secretion system protein VirD4